jgi:RNA polymerase sigma-70 factor, ECF subfamily
MMISAHADETKSGLETLGHRVGEKVASCGHTFGGVATPADEVLVSRIARGEQIALRALMARHQLRIARFIRRFVSDRTVVEDLACDTFFAAWQHAPHFENRSSVATWLMAIARYKALSARERQTVPTEPLDEVLATTIAETGLQPDAVVERDDWARYLRQCLGALPAEQAQLIELVYFRDKSIKEVALLKGIPENTVKSRLFLARKKLAAMLNAAEFARDPVSLVPDAVPAPIVPERAHARASRRAGIPAARQLALA